MATLFNPHQYFADPNKGRPVFNGFIYIGRADTDPTETDNRLQVSLICECGGMPVNISQPVRTGAGGVPVYNGSPAQINVPLTEFSILVQDKDQRQVYYSPRATGFNQFSAENAVTHETFAILMAGSNETTDFARTGDRNQSTWRKVGESEYNDFPGMVNHSKFIDGAGNFWIYHQLTYVYLSHIEDAQSALDVAGGSTLIFDQNADITSDGLQVSNNTRIIGDGFPVITQTKTGDNAGFRIPIDSENIHIEGLQVRGPYYNETVVFSAESIGISVEGHWREDRLSGPIPESATTNITVTRCIIDGFGQSGILADYVTDGEVSFCDIRNCGRDGVRTYGSLNFDIVDNRIDNMGPGSGGVDPFLNVYGVTYTRVETAPVSKFRNSQRGICSRNIVSRCNTWKGLDTHGGTDIIFSDNVVLDSYIGLACDEGGNTDEKGIVATERIVFDNNIITNTSDAVHQGIGIFCTNTPGTNGDSVSITNNHITGHGNAAVPERGAIFVANYDSAIISNNLIADSSRSGITVAQSLHANIIGNTIRNVSDLNNRSGGINTSNLDGLVCVDSNYFINDNGNTFTAIEVPGGTGIAFSIGTGNTYQNVNRPASNIARITGPYLTDTIALGIIDLSSSAATIRYSTGIASATRTGAGVVTVTLAFDTPGNFSAVYFVGLRSSASGYGNATVSGRDITVYLFDEMGDPADINFYITVSGVRN